MAKEKKDQKVKQNAPAPSPSKDAQVDAVAARLHAKFKDEVVPAMMKRFNYDNVNSVPRILKIAVNMGIGAAAADQKQLEAAVRDLEAVVGQKASLTQAKKSISNFKLREGQNIGCRVTLRRDRMYEFFDRLMSLAIPRIRDFRGVPDKSFDGRGNYTLGIKEQIIFPEIDVDKVSRITGMDITFVTSATSDEEAYELLKAFGMPFRKREGEKAAA